MRNTYSMLKREDLNHTKHEIGFDGGQQETLDSSIGKYIVTLL